MIKNKILPNPNCRSVVVWKAELVALLFLIPNTSDKIIYLCIALNGWNPLVRWESLSFEPIQIAELSESRGEVGRGENGGLMFGQILTFGTFCLVGFLWCHQQSLISLKNVLLCLFRSYSSCRLRQYASVNTVRQLSQPCLSTALWNRNDSSIPAFAPTWLTTILHRKWVVDCVLLFRLRSL